MIKKTVRHGIPFPHIPPVKSCCSGKNSRRFVDPGHRILGLRTQDRGFEFQDFCSLGKSLDWGTQLRLYSSCSSGQKAARIWSGSSRNTWRFCRLCRKQRTELSSDIPDHRR